MRSLPARRVGPCIKARYRLVALFLLPVLIPGANAQLQRSTNISRELFGVVLQRSSNQLLEQVERMYGKPVRTERFDNASRPDCLRYAESDVEEDGTPVIRVGEHIRPTENVIVHELFHLKLQAEGYPGAISWEWPREEMTSGNQAYTALLFDHVFSEIVHWVFYPEMRQMGFYPQLVVMNELAEAFETGIRVGTNADTRALYYLKFALHVQDESVRARLRNIYQQNGWEEGLVLGEKLVGAITGANPRTREEILAVFLRCINLLTEGVVRFDFRGWEKRVLGSHDQVVAVIRINPIRRNRVP